MAAIPSSDPEERWIKVFLVSYKPLLRAGIRHLFDRQTDLVVAGEAFDEEGAVAGISSAAPDVVVLDAGTARGPICDLIRSLLQKSPDCKVVVLVDEDCDETLIESVEAGARAYVSERGCMAELIDAIHLVNAGGAGIPPRLLPNLLDHLMHDRDRRVRAMRQLSLLTRQERLVLRSLVGGASDRTIGEVLGISQKTARTHVQNILRKFDMHSRLEAIAFVSGYGLSEELAAGSA